MDVLVEITKWFDDEEKKLSAKERGDLTKSLNKLVQSARDVRFPRRLYRTNKLLFPQIIKREDSTMYLFKATPSLRVVLTLDDDPIFNHRIMKLMRVSNAKSITEVFNDTARLLYNSNEYKAIKG